MACHPEWKGRVPVLFHHAAPHGFKVVEQGTIKGVLLGLAVLGRRCGRRERHKYFCYVWFNEI